MSTRSVIVSILFLFITLRPALSHERSNLGAPEGSEARGEVRLESDELRIRGDTLPDGEQDLVVLVETEEDVFEPAFETTTKDDGSFEIRVRSAGDLPLGFTDFGDLAGRGLKVVSVADESVVLSGRFPAVVDDEEKGVGTSLLLPPDASPTPDASGRIRAKARDGRHTLEVRVRDLLEEQTFTVCATNEAGDSETIGAITTNEGGNGTLKLDTSKDDALPFGAGSVAEIAGVTVDVKNADGEVVLSGAIPNVGEQAPAPADEIEVEFDLSRPDDPPEPEIKGDVEFETEAQRDKVRVRIDHATSGADYMARITSAGDEPTTEQIAVLTADDNGEAEHEVRGRPIFPLGAESLADLSGALVEVLRLDENGPILVLSGTVPEVDAPPPPDEEPPPAPPLERLRFETVLNRPDGGPDSDANGKIEWEEQDDEHEIEIEIEDLDPEADYTVVITSPTGESEALFEGAADAEGDIRVNRVIFAGEPLVLGVQSFRELDGASVAVLDSDGAGILVGEVSVPESRQAKGIFVEVHEVVFTTVGRYDAWFLRGDMNGDRVFDASDIVGALVYMFLNGPAPSCLDTIDMNDDASLDIGDPVYGLVRLFRGGARLPFPGTTISGYDPTPDRLFCEDS